MGAGISRFPVRAGEPAVEFFALRLLGETTGPDISVDEGDTQGVTVSRTGTGVYRLTWASNPGKFVGFGAAFGAATPANLAGHTVVRDTFDATNYRLDLSVFNASDSAHDLVDDEYLDVVVYFQGTGL